MSHYKTTLLLTGISFILLSCAAPTHTESGPFADGTDQPDNFSTQDGPPAQAVEVADISDAIPQKEPRSRYGNPGSYEVFGQRYYPLTSSKGYKERGIASWYGSKFHGNRTSSGDAYNMHAMTAAHKTLPLPTYVKVTNLRNNRQVILKVNDRGPFHENRIIDLSHTAATKLGIIGQGTGLVEVEAIDPDSWNKDSKSVISPPQPQKSSHPVELFVQIGAFISMQNARKLQLSINNKFHQQAGISETQTNGQKFYRVRIGPLSKAEQADQISEQLYQQGFGTPRILIE